MARQRVSFFLDAWLAEGLARLRDRDGVPASEAMRRAIAEYLSRRGITLKQQKPDRPRVSPRERS